MTIISTAYVSVNISIAGCDCEQEAKVRYIHAKAIRGLRERSSGIQLEPDEPESAEILTINLGDFNIMHLLTDEQLQAVAQDVLEQGRGE